MAFPLINPIYQFFDNAGEPLSGGLVYTYAPGTTTPKTTYTDENLSVPNANPIVLDSGGRCVIFLTDGEEYKFVVQTSAAVTLKTVDEVKSPSGVTQATIGAALYPRSAAEIAATVTPTNYFYPSDNFDPRRYGAVGDGVTNDTTAVQTACTVAGQFGGTVRIPPGCVFLCNANINVPVGLNNVVDIEGATFSKVTGGIKFTGAAVTTGLTYTGSSFDYCGEIRNLYIACTSGAKRGVTMTNITNGCIDRCRISSAAGCAVFIDTSLMCRLSRTIITGCGSATEGSVEVLMSTTFYSDQLYISGGNTTVGGLLIDKTNGYAIIAGAVESCGKLIRIGSKTDTTVGNFAGIIHGVDLENPGNNPFIEMGLGLNGVFVAGCHVAACAGYPSGSAQIDYAVSMQNCVQVEWNSNNWAQAGTPLATYQLASTNNFGIQIRAHRALAGNAYPWVLQNGSLSRSASPFYDWNSDNSAIGRTNISGALSGATPSILISSTQGGYYRHIGMTNGGATTVTALTGGEQGMEIIIIANDANTTLTHSTVTANQFNLIGNANLNLATGKAYKFLHTGTLWLQV